MNNYFEDALAYINNTDAPEPEEAPLKAVTGIKTHVEQQKLYNGASGRSIAIAPDGRSITVNGVTYITPEWYNKDQIKNGDAKTVEMVLIHYGLM